MTNSHHPLRLADSTLDRSRHVCARCSPICSLQIGYND
jgi:hypothetical protein